MSNNPLVVKACQPTVAVMSNGPTKGAMPETVKTIRTTDSIVGIYQLHRNERPGEAANNAPDEFVANKEAGDHAGNYVRCSVDPDAKAYVVGIPATHHEQRYETKAK